VLLSYDKTSGTRSTNRSHTLFVVVLEDCVRVVPPPLVSIYLNPHIPKTHSVVNYKQLEVRYVLLHPVGIREDQKGGVDVGCVNEYTSKMNARELIGRGGQDIIRSKSNNWHKILSSRRCCE
jgi:hypothetical protein